MWLVSSLQLVPRTFDFSSSGQPARQDVALHADGIELANMLRSIDWEEDPVQVEVCNACGIVGCASGGYVAIRRLGPFVVFALSPRGYLAGDEAERSQYMLPAEVRRKGEVPLVPVAEWERARSAGAPLPAAASFKSLTWDEAFLVAQFEAPYRLLGVPGELRAEPLSKAVVATDPWLDAGTLDRLGTRAEWTRRRGTPVPLREGFQPISLILEDPLATVDLFAQTDQGIGFLLAPGVALFPGASA